MRMAVTRTQLKLDEIEYGIPFTLGIPHESTLLGIYTLRGVAFAHFLVPEQDNGPNKILYTESRKFMVLQTGLPAEIPVDKVLQYGGQFNAMDNGYELELHLFELVEPPAEGDGDEQEGTGRSETEGET